MSPGLLTSVQMFIEGEKRPPKSSSSEMSELVLYLRTKEAPHAFLQLQEASEFRAIRGMFLEQSSEKTGTL